MGRTLIAFVLGIALIATSCASSPTSSGPAGGPEGSGSPDVIEIRSISDLRSVFSDDDGTVRIILSMSPT